jgi:glutathione S-transferase
MIEFHAGTGPDSQAVGIALEEMFLDYRIAPQRSPVPVTIVGYARMPDAANILMALARKTGRFLPDAMDAAPWLAKTPPDLSQLEEQLADRDFILGAYSIADMAMYPIAAQQAEKLSACPNVMCWVKRMSLRPAVGRGMGAVSR